MRTDETNQKNSAETSETLCNRENEKEIDRVSLIGFGTIIGLAVGGPIGMVAVGSALSVGVGGKEMYKKQRARKLERKQFSIAASKSIAVNGIGSLAQLDSSVRKQFCDAGYYCDHSGKAYPCGRIDFFCPVGSDKPTKVYEGFYTTGGTAETRTNEALCEPGHYCFGGKKKSCPAGTFGDIYSLKNSTCSGLCKQGHYCPEGTVIQIACKDPSKFCPEGASHPIEVQLGYYSIGGESYSGRTNESIAPKGYYALKGLLFKCPAGKYGDREGQTDPSCSGRCQKGFYCPPGSATSAEKYCGGPDRFCPEMSASPLIVREGYYTTSIEEKCPPGKFMSLSSMESGTTVLKCTLCEVGTYKYQKGNEENLCLPCFGAAHSNEDRISCTCIEAQDRDRKSHFDILTGKCERVQENSIPLNINEYIENTQLTKEKEFPCEKGYWCKDGVRRPCPAGSYGDLEKETRPGCRGKCLQGFWCGNASTMSNQNKCGGPNSFCPEGSSYPSYVSRGYFTNAEGNPMTRDSQTICPQGFYCRDGVQIKCPAGRYGKKLGLSSKECDGLCQEGYFCSPGSTSDKQEKCGNVTVHCPQGSSLPSITLQGHYSVKSKYEIDSSLLYDEENSTAAAAKICEKGFWCSYGKKYQCPEGTYGTLIGSDTADECLPCKPGYYCPSYPGPPSTNSTIFECGEQKYCPLRSSKPLYISIGYYGMGGLNESVMIDQRICPPGHYCDRGIKIACPEGTFGDSSGLSHHRCSGFCPAGFYCEEGSTVPMECPYNTFSSRGWSICAPCYFHEEKIDRNRCRTSRACCSQ